MSSQHSPLAIPLTNLPLHIGTRRFEDGRVELVSGTINVFNGQLRIAPSTDERVQKLVSSEKEQALKEVSATLFIESDLPSALVARGMTPPDIPTLVCSICDLLSFARRRGVSFVPDVAWWSGQEPVVRGKCQRRGPVETTREIEKLVANGLPKAFDPIFRDAQRVTLALRWFLGWHEERSVEMKFVRLWIPLEMLSRRYWDHLGQEPPSRHPAVARAGRRVPAMDYIWGFVDALGIPNASQVPLNDMYLARNEIVHGDPEAAEQNMCARFGDLARIRRDKLSAPSFPGAPQLDPARLPNPTSYGMCLYEAAEMLSRLLEKIFLNLFDCRDGYFYSVAPYHTTIGP
jgi:hypothetical protein